MKPSLSFLRRRSTTASEGVGRALGIDILPQDAFLRMLVLERKRTERSNRRFVLLLLESQYLMKDLRQDKAIGTILTALSHSTRETDIKGWYEHGSTIGVIFTEIGAASGMAVANALNRKVTNAMCDALTIDQIQHLRISFYIYPANSDQEGPNDSSDSPLYPDLAHNFDSAKPSLKLKRFMDIIGSIFALTIALPLLLAIALLIKVTSKGPVLFRQERLGQYGKRFTFLKFRSMFINNDPSVHIEYVKRFIGAQVDTRTQGKPTVYKLTRDPRVTRIGTFLRTTSLDELPQFVNVLLGHMSLVGPRPPLPYEFTSYNVWHRKRLLSVKPGITGLWQVEGRSRVTFDEMVRLDLKYARSWSLWLDIKILLKTPRAVLTGHGAH
jgi:lipopolysaccharide/colanic/teichoic acid biosynthesis glycosyltransferase